ncbi:MAG: SiaB family protein kinase [Bacteroidota bacterium]
MSFDLNKYYDELTENQDTLMTFKGSVSSGLINEVLEDVESKLLDANEAVRVRKKVYNVMVESLQNLYHHVDDLPDDLGPEIDHKFGLLVISKLPEGYKITTGNFINSHKIKHLKDKIDKINSLTPEELKDMYKFILNHQKLSAKGGGGLGLVDISRKTGNKLHYRFIPVNNDYYFFVLEVFINK